MNYEMQELIPIVAELAQKLTGFESTSVTYEKAGQLMEAVIYCINELSISEKGTDLFTECLSAEKAYKAGYACTVEKVKAAMKIYDAILNEFDGYGNRCLHDTIIKGMPEFFKWYDVKFEPQNTILTLDYPVMKDISRYQGVDAIYEYLLCIRSEQKFLSRFGRSYIKNILSRYDGDYKNGIENIFQIVWENAICHVLIGKPLEEQAFLEEECEQLKSVLQSCPQQEIKEQLQTFTEKFVNQYFEKDVKMLEYLDIAVCDILIRLKNAAEYDVLLSKLCLL